MNTHKTKYPKTVAVIKNSHTSKQMEEMGERFVTSKEPILTIQQILELERKKNLQPV
jgi:hypothetical protein